MSLNITPHSVFQADWKNLYWSYWQMRQGAAVYSGAVMLRGVDPYIGEGWHE